METVTLAKMERSDILANMECMNISMEGKKKQYPIRPRLKDRTSYRGNRGYFITIVTYKREKFFTKTNVVDSLVRYLRKTSKQHRFSVIAFCFMPDHLHLVLEGDNETSNLEAYIKAYKQVTGFHFKHIFEKPLWATSYYDHVLRKEQNIKSVGRYTLLNPIRAGMVQDICEYPFVGSFVYNIKELVADDPFLKIENIDR